MNDPPVRIEPASPSQRLDSRSPAELLALLVTCPLSIFESVVREIMNRICLNLGNLSYSLKDSDRDGRSQTLTFSRVNLALRGFGSDEVHCLILAGDSKDWAASGSTFWKQITSPTALPIIITANHDLTQVVLGVIGLNYALVLSNAETETLMSSSNGLEQLKTILRNHFNLSVLSPFNDHLQLNGPFFVGRRNEIDRLIEDEATNYVIIGPSGMGKSSLVAEYQRRLRAGKVSRHSRATSLYKLPVSGSTLIQAVMRCIDGTRENYYAESTVEKLKHQLAIHNSRFDTRIEIILDEVDDHVHLSAMKSLVDLAKENKLRLILVGRWNLCRAKRHDTAGNFDRMEEILLEPLSAGDAEDVVYPPLRDMRIDFKGAEAALKAALRQLGYVPAGLHEFGRQLVAIVQARGGRVATADLIDLVWQHIAKHRRVQSVLRDLSSDVARVAAILLLLNPEDFTDITPSVMKAALSRSGVHVKIAQAAEICDELVILHALTSPEPDSYRPGAWRGAMLKNAQRVTCREQLQELLALVIPSSIP